MVITCPTCGHQGKVDPSRIPSQGAKAKCPKCQNGFMISGAPPQQPAVSAPPPVSPSQANSQPTASKAPPPQTPEPVAQTQQAQPQEPPLPEPESQPPAQGTSEPSLGFAGENPAPAAGGGLSLKAPSPEAVASKDVACTECLKLFKEGEVSQVGDRVLCQSCQESMQAKAQKPSQSGARPAYGKPSKGTRLDFAGFWIRAGAYAVDLFILFLVWHFVLSPVLMKVATKMMTDTTVPLSMSFSQDQVFTDPAQMEEFVTQMEDSMNQMQSKMLIWVYSVNLAGLLLMAGYFIVLEGRNGQTLGKKALNLRVVTPDGDRIGYIKAFVRYVGKVVSWIILGIGFIMAAFDGEKRALHDRMCETRVIRE